MYIGQGFTVGIVEDKEGKDKGKQARLFRHMPHLLFRLQLVPSGHHRRQRRAKGYGKPISVTQALILAEECPLVLDRRK